jgi:hypothetical protein
MTAVVIVSAMRSRAVGGVVPGVGAMSDACRRATIDAVRCTDIVTLLAVWGAIGIETAIVATAVAVTLAIVLAVMDMMLYRSRGVLVPSLGHCQRWRS